MPDQPFESLTRLPDVSFRTRDVDPPSTVYITPEEGLILSVFSSQATQKINVRGRILLADGRISPFQFIFPQDNSRLLNLFNLTLPEGFLLGVNVTLLSATTRHGETYAVLELARGTSFLTATSDTVLCQGYVSGSEEIWWPDGYKSPSVFDRGMQLYVVGTDPAAGVEISQTVPGGAIWRLQAMRFSLVTSAVAGARTVRLAIDDGANVILNIPNAAGQAASLTQFYNYGPGFPQTGVFGTEVLVPLPNDLYLIPGSRFRTSTAGLDPGDNFGAPVFLVEEWKTS